MPNCHNCGGAVSQYASDCGHCGISLEEDPTIVICSDCNTKNLSKFLHCRDCGTRLPKDSTLVELDPERTQNNLDWTDFKSWSKERKQKVGATLLIASLILIIVFRLAGDEVSDDKPNEDAISRTEATATTSLPSSYPTRIHPTVAPTRVPTPMPTATVPPEPIQMDLTDVLEQYDLNKVRADSMLRYLENGNSPVATSGFVSEVDRNHVVIVPTQDRYTSQSLICHYADIRTALHLSKGQPVSVTGKIRGVDGIFSRVHMFSCDVEGVELDKQPDAAAQELQDNVVQVYCLSGSIFSPDRKGTGVILDPSEGVILTVHHVVADENECDSIEVEGGGVKGRQSASVVKHCASIDRARLSVSTTALARSSLKHIYRATAPAQQDQDVFFWGYGRGELRMEQGIVVDVWSDTVITDAYAVPGDSGSPVFNRNGHLLGTLSRSNRSDRAVFTGDEC